MLYITVLMHTHTDMHTQATNLQCAGTKSALYKCPEMYKMFCISVLIHAYLHTHNFSVIQSEVVLKIFRKGDCL